MTDFAHPRGAPGAVVRVLCKCGCGLEVPEGRDLYATVACNARVQHARRRRRERLALGESGERRLIVDPTTSRRVRRLAERFGRPASSVLEQVLGDALQAIERSLISEASACSALARAAADARVRHAKITAHDALVVVANETGVGVDELAGRDRSRRVSDARAACAWVCRLGGLPLSAIAAALGGRDHTTIMHLLGTCATRLADPAYAARVRLAAQALGLEWPFDAEQAPAAETA